MNILTDILSLIKRKKFVSQAKSNDVLVLGINEEPEIEGIASPVPYKDVKLIKVSDFLSAGSVEAENVPIGASEAGCFKDKVTDPVTGDVTLNFRRLKSLSLDLTITENGDYVEFDLEPDTGIWSIPNSVGRDIYYDTFQDALDNANPGETVYLHTNVEETGAVTVGLKDNVNVNFNGFKYTLNEASNINAIVDGVTGTSCVLSNGIILRKGAAVTGGQTDTLALYIQSASSKITCENMIFTNDNGVACRVDGETRGIKGKGTVAGISCGIASYLYDSIGFGVDTATGIISNSAAKFGAIYNCIGYSDSGDGISADVIDVIGCKGYSGGLSGISYSTGKLTDSTGYSSYGDGIRGSRCIVINCIGYSEDGLGFEAGISLTNPTHIEACAGYGSSNSSGIKISSTGVVTQITASNSSGYGQNGLELFQDQSQGAANTVSTFLNCSFTSSNEAVRIERADPAKAEFMNCSFYTTSDISYCINGVAGTPVDIKYANCSFKTGDTSVGTPLNNVNQTITNTTDNQGNTYI